MGAAVASVAVAAAAPLWSPERIVGGILGDLRGPTLAMLQQTLLRPLTLGPDVVAAWSLTRNIAAALLLAALLYAVLRAQVGPLLGWPAPSPWLLLPRLALAALGIATSLPLARGLLAANNAFCAALLHAAPAGPTGILTGAVAGPLLTLGGDLAALVVFAGLVALVCFYLVRAAEIVLLTLLLPLAAALWVVPAAEGVYRAIFGELLVSVFVQSMQVVVLLVFAAGTGVPGRGVHTAWLWSLAALALIFRCRALLAAAVGAAGRWAPDMARAAGGLGPRLSGAVRAAGRAWSGPGSADDLAGL